MCQPLDALLLAMPEVPAPAVGPDDIVYTLEGGVHYPPRKLREHPPGDLQVDGRFFKAPVVQVTVLESRVVIRLDDEQQPEQWVELVISEELLNLWVRNQRDAQEAEDDSTADFE